jgi:DNA repair protein RecN (Recombination protein N)
MGALVARRADGWLRTLTVEGFGLIDRTSVELRPGLNVFTGETGSGKSMVIDALGFAFGARAGSDLVRAGSEKAAAVAEVEPNGAAKRWLFENGFESDPGEPLILSREMLAQGRSSARINGKPATASQLRELGDILLDVVGQHEHTRLARPALHRELLDEFAGEAAREALTKVRTQHARLRALRAQIEALRISESAAARALGDGRFAATEIEAARLQPGEIETLRERRSLLANAAKIGEALDAAGTALGAPDRGAISTIGNAAAALDQVSKYAQTLREFADAARGLQGAVQDLHIAVAAQADEAAGDPGALDAVEDRLAVIARLQKKYGTTIEEILTAGERFAEQARTLERRDRDVAELEHAAAECASELTAAASMLTAIRVTAAKRLSARVEGELIALGMRGASYRCAVDPLPEEAGPDGADRVEFFASLNAKEPERPVARSASGGELARLLLALKVALAEVDPHPIVVLDEIDAGIGGVAARAVGSRIAALARSVQVLCVTHLAQIAAQGDENILLSKVANKNRVTIEARVLGNRDSLRTEIARMLSGDEKGEEALKHAEALLRDVRNRSDERA